VVRARRANVLFWPNNSGEVFPRQIVEALRLAGLRCSKSPEMRYGGGLQRMSATEISPRLLGRYLYRAFLPEKNIIADTL